MQVAMCHYEKIITNRKKTISEIQTETITILNNPSLNNRQMKALKRTYEQMLTDNRQSTTHLSVVFTDEILESIVDCSNQYGEDTMPVD